MGVRIAGHIVDSDAFPFESTTFPAMSQEGAYSFNHIYTHRDVSDVIKYAKDRGIREPPHHHSSEVLAVLRVSLISWPRPGDGVGHQA